MSERAGVVIDTNILVSAMLSSRSVSRQTLLSAAQTCILLASEATMAEAEDVLQRAKLMRWFRVLLAQNSLSVIVKRSNSSRSFHESKFAGTRATTSFSNWRAMEARK